jgi:hypothetical protein
MLQAAWMGTQFSMSTLGVLWPSIGTWEPGRLFEAPRRMSQAGYSSRLNGARRPSSELGLPRIAPQKIISQFGVITKSWMNPHQGDLSQKSLDFTSFVQRIYNNVQGSKTFRFIPIDYQCVGERINLRVGSEGQPKSGLRMGQFSVSPIYPGQRYIEGRLL